MNEKIKELAQQCGATHKINLGVYQFYEQELMEFSASLVEHCIDALYYNGYTDAASLLYKTIKSKLEPNDE